MNVRKISSVLLVIGLVWLASEYWEDHIRPSRLKVPGEAELSVVTGTATAARVVEQKTRRGVLASRVVELDLTSRDQVTTVRLSPASPESVLTGIGGRTVAATVDPREQNLVYALSTSGRPIIAYQDIADYKKRVAQSDGSGGKAFGWLALALGIAGLVFSRKTEPQQVAIED